MIDSDRNRRAHSLIWVSIAAAAVLTWTVVAAAAEAPRTMQAARADVSTPGRLTIETVNVPVPQTGQVLVEIYAAGLNPNNWRIDAVPPAVGPAGTGAPGAPPSAARPIHQPGDDFAGVVVALGPGVTGFKVGDKVVGALQQVGGGAFAQYAVALASVLALKPEKFTFEQAAGLPTASFTGLRMEMLADIKKGERVLVIGAAGGLGSTAVQAAKTQGAHVIASAASQHNAYLRALGADEIVNYDQEKVGDQVKNVDVVINTVGSENAASLTYVKRGGRVVQIVGQPDKAACDAAGVTCSNGGPGRGPADGELLQRLIDMVNAGTFTVQVEKSFPLAAVNDAYVYGRTGNRQGKLVLDMRSDASRR